MSLEILMAPLGEQSSNIQSLVLIIDLFTQQHCTRSMITQYGSCHEAKQIHSGNRAEFMILGCAPASPTHL